ncbi:DNA polymerase IV [Xiashengella succiniciproducens]|jgi:DNA polymerase-4|uniref:DNA polymerase IV n=1 Tax=Xiashengella succiniciproducens TaxID=2949635 RepID=A0A9J6ZPF9_9BACT|nr:DNA polymerase IV [Alkaliflexus sp. Ai-910]URW79573.1 DNA polymerase IV [Alkaliflexus sp. Ai-910]HHU00904.1 DNA polymerase IV [Bacteroidales bacterium]
MERTIVHCDLDTFFVSVERLINGSLVGKPVLIGGSSDRGVVSACSYEARRFGVHSAMPMRLAKQLCPEAILIRGDMELYAKYSNMVTEIIEETVPVVEKASIDEHYIDMTGMDRFFGSWKLAQELRRRIIKETGLPISLGFSVNKTVSKIATGEAKPCGERRVEKGTEKGFLAPLSIRKIPGIGEKTYPLLRNMGISQIRTLQEMDALTLRRVLGQNGVVIWNKANGVDNSEVIPFHQNKSISKEHTFDQDTIDMVQLRKIMLSMADELAFDLRRDGRLTSCVTVKIRYSNFDTHTMQAKLPYTASERLISEKVLELFNKLYSRRMLIRLIGVRLSNLIWGAQQLDLFEDRIEDINLSRAIDRIRIKYGHQAIVRGFAL